MAEIAFHNVSKCYGKIQALNSVSFTLRDNAFFCLFGPPPSGKTSILRILLGLETPDTGEVLIDGKAVNRLGPGERDIAMVFQNLALFPHMSARENVIFPLVERNMAKSDVERRLADVSKTLHITHILHKPPAQLSGGERQRVAIARALVRDPVACLMDDPISALDARLRESTRVKLKRIQRELGRTLIYVTHDQEEAMSVADTMAILVDGKIQQIGTPDEVYRKPDNLAVAGLLGSPAINLLPLARNGKTYSLADGSLTFASSELSADAQTIGIRPEDLKVTPWDSKQINKPATVFQTEPLGGTTVLTIESGDMRLKALLRGQPDFRPDMPVTQSCDPARTHFFNARDKALR